MGYKINEKTHYEEGILLDIANNNTIQPICFDATPSSQIWGAAITEPKTREAPDTSYMMHTLMISVGMLLGLVILGFYLARKYL